MEAKLINWFISQQILICFEYEYEKERKKKGEAYA